MLVLSEHQDCPDVSPLQRGWADLLKRIRKLRWIGLEEEASRLEVTLIRRCVEASCAREDGRAD